MQGRGTTTRVEDTGKSGFVKGENPLVFGFKREKGLDFREKGFRLKPLLLPPSP